MEVNRIVLGNCQKVLTEVVDNSVDLVVTDPPYGYSFMGKDWDKAVPRVAIWRECLRVLKPGAFAFVMSSPRADVLSHMIVNLSDAGFRTDFTPIYWAYASGFPKAMNIGKAVDKRLGAEREVITTIKKTHISNENTNEGWKRPSHEGKTTMDITKPSSDEAKLLDGSYGGFQPKPAVEVIIVAMKPLSEKTFVDQALKNQKGITWLDDSRIPFEPQDVEQHNTQAKSGLGKAIYGEYKNNLVDTSELLRYNTSGRFPANLLVSDDCLNDGINRRVSYILPTTKQNRTNTEFLNLGHSGFQGYADEGSFSRYFSLDAWFEKQFKRLPLEVQRTFPFMIEPKASKTERNHNCENLETIVKPSNMRTCNGTGERSVTQGFPETKVKNFHPTVKPLQLMTYLITLGSRSNDLILDPFVGSGTTCLAAKMLGRRYIGIEIKKEYVALAEIRVGNHRTLFEFGVPEFATNHAQPTRSEIK